MFELSSTKNFEEQMKEMGFNKMQIRQISEITRKQQEDNQHHLEQMYHLLQSFQKDNKNHHEQMAKSHTSHLKVVENQFNQLKNDEVTTQALNGLNNAVKQKAKEIVSKSGIQISLESYFDPKTMTADEKIRMDKNFQETFNRDVGKVSSAIKVSLKKYLGMKGNAPDKTFKQVNMDLAHKYVNKLKAKDLNL